MIRRPSISIIAALVCLGLGSIRSALAHVGPPFPVLVDQPIPGHVVSVWADPDIGEALFYVVLEPGRSGAPQPVSKVNLWVQPVSGRLPKKVYEAKQERARGHLRFVAKPEFDAAELWKVGIDIRLANGTDHSLGIEIEATPPGLGPWDLLVYLIPFLLFGGLWAFAFLRRSRRASRGAARPPPPEHRQTGARSGRRATLVSGAGSPGGTEKVLMLLVAVGWMGCSGRNTPEQAASDRPLTPEAVGAFYAGVSALDVEENGMAGNLFGELSEKLPDEPAVWLNLGMARLRLGDLTGADEALDRAAKLAPEHEQVTLLRAIADERRGDFARAIERLRSISNPDIEVLHRLAELLERTGRAEAPREQLEVLNRIRDRRPDNLVAAFSRARLLARMEEGTLLAEAVKDLERHRADWGPDAVEQLEAVKAAIAGGDFRKAATHLTFLQNLNLATPAYQEGLAELGVAGGSVGRPIREFLKYPEPEVVVAAADTGLYFAQAPGPTQSAAPQLHLALMLSSDPGATIVSVSDGVLTIGDRAKLPAAGDPAASGRSSLCAVDLNDDFLQDLAWISSQGLKLWFQNEGGGFTDFQPSEEVRPLFERAGRGVWALDYEADGDLDLLLGLDGTAPVILRNNRDGGFTPIEMPKSFPEVRELCWNDFDGDGDGDLAFLDSAGRVLVSWNQRAGEFAAPEAVSETPALALTSGDVRAVGQMNLVVLKEGGVVSEFGFDRAKQAWSGGELARWSNPPSTADGEQPRGGIGLADLDNNGAVDLVASLGVSTAIWLNEGNAGFQRHGNGDPLGLFVMSIADVDNDGFLDLTGPTASGALTLRAQGKKGYRWQSIQTRALTHLADGRINSYGIGGRIEIRAGGLVSVQPITSPSTHFGLGDHDGVGVARIVWPNGIAQVEFDLQANQQVTAVQRLKGSCPWVFVRDGDTFRFVKDFIWRSPLGMRINSQDTAGVDQTEDWIFVSGELLTPQNGAYEIRITAELWETHFFDHISLMIVDHPSEFAAYVDERFVPTQQPKLEVIAAGVPRSFAWAQDESGCNVLKAVSATDGDYVDGFPLGRFQGIAEDHWVEFQLPEDAPLDRPLVLIGEGWIYPTDSSLNVAISQGNHPAPRGLVLEARDPEGSWQPVSGDLGFPAGKNKTVVIPLPGEALRAGRRHFRLRTNLEIYWDRLGWAELLPDAETRSIPAETLVAELRHRGFSNLGPPERRKPDIPEYDQLAGTGPRWRDLEGFYTRFGDVRELLHKVDDRYVIMNAGDEIVLRFAAPAPPPAGWTRDFVLIGDGWVKDGDFNTAHSRTVHPLPSHGVREYGGPARALADDPVFQQRVEDWSRYHTRYVAPWVFERGIMNNVRTRSLGGSR